MTPEQLAELPGHVRDVVALIQAGKTQGVVASELGIAKASVQRRLILAERLTGTTLRPQGRRIRSTCTSPGELRELYDAAFAGASMRGLGRKHGMSADAIRVRIERAAKLLGLPMPQPARRGPPKGWKEAAYGLCDYCQIRHAPGCPERARDEAELTAAELARCPRCGLRGPHECVGHADDFATARDGGVWTW